MLPAKEQIEWIEVKLLQPMLNKQFVAWESSLYYQPAPESISFRGKNIVRGVRSLNASGRSFARD
jgi:hypothetical protein